MIFSRLCLRLLTRRHIFVHAFTANVLHENNLKHHKLHSTCMLCILGRKCRYVGPPRLETRKFLHDKLLRDELYCNFIWHMAIFLCQMHLWKSWHVSLSTSSLDEVKIFKAASTGEQAKLAAYKNLSRKDCSSVTGLKDHWDDIHPLFNCSTRQRLPLP